MVEVVTHAEVRSWWAEEPPDSWPQLASSDPVAVVWTSGTTGQPKGALFDHANLAAVAHRTDVFQPPRGPPALTGALRPRGLHDPRLGRDRQRRHDGHHAHTVAGRRRHPRHGG